MTNIPVSDMQQRHLEIINFVSIIIDSNNSVWDDATKRAVVDDDDAVQSVACDDTLDDKIVLMVDSGTDDTGMLGTRSLLVFLRQLCCHPLQS